MYLSLAASFLLGIGLFTLRRVDLFGVTRHDWASAKESDMNSIRYQLWLLKDPANNGRDLQCWFQTPERAIRETTRFAFARRQLIDIKRCNPGRQYELRTAA